jgi:hypothetical protein
MSEFLFDGLKNFFGKNVKKKMMTRPFNKNKQILDLLIGLGPML